jgi:hypothetical protein
MQSIARQRDTAQLHELSAVAAAATAACVAVAGKLPSTPSLSQYTSGSADLPSGEQLSLDAAVVTCTATEHSLLQSAAAAAAAAAVEAVHSGGHRWPECV